jgi:hypothetical protein
LHCNAIDPNNIICSEPIVGIIVIGTPFKGSNNTGGILLRGLLVDITHGDSIFDITVGIDSEDVVVWVEGGLSL